MIESEVSGRLARTFPPLRRRYLMWFGALGGVALIALVVAVILITPSGSDTKAAPNFSFTLYQGEAELGAEMLDISQLRGKPVILNFWAGLCPPCRTEMVEFQQFYRLSEQKEQVTLIGIDVGPFLNLGSYDDAQNLMRELNIDYPTGFTDDGSVVGRYGVVGMPTTVFIDSRGEIYQKRTGIVTLSLLKGILGKLLEHESRKASREIAAGETWRPDRGSLAPGRGPG